MTLLLSGHGLCQPQARLLIKPLQVALDLGAAPDIVSTLTRAVHHANRHGQIDDFIAIAFPQMHMGREVMQAGHEIELIGSEQALLTFQGLEGYQRLTRRAMIEAREVHEIFFDEGEIGTAFVRDRHTSKKSAGQLRRNAARAERRGISLGPAPTPRDPDPQCLMLRHGDAVLHIREMTGPFVAGPLSVSTYGFSASSAPAYLPLVSDRMRETMNAA